METIDLISKLWPIAIGFVSLVIVLAKLDNRVSVLEEKVKTLFEFHNHEHHDK
jgi:hypothetical protein